ncbi:MAG: MMPL family transporter [Alphaproteobacteria bacterium]|nr:MMPL family transporter [Alphaproteobacteria bacterium]MCB9793985.1 MMPL family transporter [Alphaproteobacteria bacterium]
MTPETIFGRWGRFVLHNRKLVRAVVIALTVLGALLASRLTVDSYILRLMPQDDPSVIALNQLVEEEGGVNFVTIAVKGEPEATQVYLDGLEERLEAEPTVDYAIHDIDDELAWRLGLLRLSPEELGALRDRLDGALALGPAITNPFIASRLLDLGPMTEKLNSADARAGLMSSDGMERLVIKPKGSAQDLPFARALMAAVDAAVAASDPAAAGVEIVYISGSYRFNVEDYEGILSDVSRTGLASVAMVFLLLTFAFRDPRALFYLLVPLGAATVWTFGFAGVTVGVLNTFTSVLGALLVGLGIDFSIHLFTRYQEERGRSESVEEAVIRAWDRVGPPCLAAAVTSAGGFSALMFAHFKGFAQMGLLLCVGVLLCLWGVLTILPLLLAWRERRPRRWKRRAMRLMARRPPTYRLAPLGLLLLVSVTAALAAFVPKIDFEYDLSELRREGASFGDLSETEQELTKASYAAIVASYPDEASLSADHVRLNGMLAAGELPHIERVVSIRTVIPEDQGERLAILRQIADMSGDENYNYLPAPIRENLARVSTTPLTPLTAEDLPRELRHLVGASAGRHRLLLFPSGNIWDLRETHALRDEVWSALPDVPVAGQYVALGSLYELVRRDAPIVGGVAILLVFLGTLLDLRQPTRAIGAALVLGAGMLWAGGMVAIAGIKLSIVNIVGVPILLGIGVDVVIHLLHRLAEEGPGKVLKALATTGFAAGLSAATTILSFASLVLATNRGIRSLGMLVLVGLTTVTIAAFLMLPVGWMTIWKIGGEAPADEEEGW